LDGLLSKIWHTLKDVLYKQSTAMSTEFATWIHRSYFSCLNITVAAHSKARTVFACLNAAIAGSNLTQAMDVCIHLFCLCCPVCR
jgi:hypothetical protein